MGCTSDDVGLQWESMTTHVGLIDISDMGIIMCLAHNDTQTPNLQRHSRMDQLHSQIYTSKPYQDSLNPQNPKQIYAITFNWSIQTMAWFVKLLFI